MFSFERGIPLAVVKGGKNKNKVLRVYTEDSVNDEKKPYGRKKKVVVESESDYSDDEEDNDTQMKKYEMNPELKTLYDSDILDEDFFKDNKINRREQDAIRKAIFTRQYSKLDIKQLEFTKRAFAYMKEKQKKEFSCNDGEVFPVHRGGKDGMHICVVGPTGAGKSYFVAEWARNYKKIYPFNKMFLFSRKDEDDNFKSIQGLRRIIIDEKLVEAKIDALKAFKNSLVIFDDVTMIHDKDVLAEVLHIRDDLLQNGRSYGVSVVSTHHQLQHVGEAKLSLNESRLVVLFPKSGAPSVNYFLEKYMALKAKDRRKLMGFPSRWICVKKDYPIVFMHQRGAYMP